jgi:hypothetical protein
MSILEAPIKPTSAEPVVADLPECLRRDHLTSAYFPNTSRAAFATVAALCAVFLATSLNRLNHTDLWGHVSYGRWIAEHRALPAVDPFAASPSTQPVLQHAWLSQLAGYWTKQTLGNEGLAFGHALLVTLTAAAVIVAVNRRGTPLVWAAAAGLAMLVLDLPIVGTIRPQLFGQLSLACVLVACSELPARRHPLVWLPLVMALWANLHSSTIVGLAVLGIYAAGVTVESLRAAEWNVGRAIRDGHVQRMGLAVLLAIAGCSLNPHGPAILLHSLSFGGRETLAFVSEWRRTEPTSLTFFLLAVSLVATSFAFKYSERRWKWYEFALLGLFAVATLMTIRMLAWWAVVWPWIVVPHLASAVSRLLRERGWTPTADEPTAMRTLMAIALVFSTIIISPPTYAVVTGHARGEIPSTVDDTPVHVADELVRISASGKFFAPMDWSDYLIWRSGAELKPLLYSHIHLADREVWNDYVAISTADKSALERLRQRGIRYVVASRQRNPQLARSLIQLERAGEGVRVFYKDQKAVIAELKS